MFSVCTVICRTSALNKNNNKKRKEKENQTCGVVEVSSSVSVNKKVWFLWAYIKPYIRPRQKEREVNGNSDSSLS